MQFFVPICGGSNIPLACMNVLIPTLISSVVVNGGGKPNSSIARSLLRRYITYLAQDNKPPPSHLLSLRTYVRTYMRYYREVF